MNEQAAGNNPQVYAGFGGIYSNSVMTLKDHKRLNDLAYSVKAFIDANGGLNDSEACFFGNIMTNIIKLK